MTQFSVPVKVKSEDRETRKNAKGWQASTENKSTHAGTEIH